MPQIAQLAETYSSQIFWLLVFFGITFFLIGKGMVPKVMDGVVQRDRQISDDLAAAQAARDASDEREEEWRERENANRAEAQAMIAQAKDRAAAVSEDRLANAQGELDRQLAEAEAEIARARAGALAEIEMVAAEATQGIVARLAGAQVDKPAARAAVQKVLAHA